MILLFLSVTLCALRVFLSSLPFSPSSFSIPQLSPIPPPPPISPSISLSAKRDFLGIDPIKISIPFQATGTRKLMPLQATQKSDVKPEVLQPKKELLTKLQSEKMDVMSLNTINDHWKYYESCISNFNALNKWLTDDLKDKTDLEIENGKLRMEFERSTIILHELYFENTNPKRLTPSPEFAKRLEDGYGSFQNIENDLVSVGFAEGIGWAVLLYDPSVRKEEETKGSEDNDSSSLIVGFVRGNDLPSIKSYVPLIVIDAWEHSFVRDFGVLGKKEALRTYMKYLDWDVIEKRYNSAMNKKE
ncbi:putative superoxide dismutase [Monocercomonoides exilis]|uniref:putative superoxide dismutase n=1 Tax=Monocercomonoides exilis TaxID=2049356 RepID=UPI00355972CB|nr:putative superoxide dismutase [Monocercomonoides exilis]